MTIIITRSSEGWDGVMLDFENRYTCICSSKFNTKQPSFFQPVKTLKTNKIHTRRNGNQILVLWAVF